MTDSGDSVTLKSLKAKRSQIKGQCTRVTTYLEGLNAQTTSLIELRQRLHKFNETWDVFNGIQSAIEEIETSPEDEPRHNEERRSFEEKYFALASELESLVESKLSAVQGANMSQITRHLREGTPATFASGNDHLKLPRVNLPIFSGAFEEWTTFRNMFHSMIDQNATLPNTQKMQYLISSLKGEALDVVSDLEVSNENYTEAWEMFRERYDDAGTIIQKHIKALFEIPAVPKQDSTSLRRLLDNVLKRIRTLKALGRPTEHWDDLIVQLIVSRLDSKTNLAWELTVERGQVPTLKQLTEFLAQHCKALDAAARNQRAGSSGSNREKSNQLKSTVANIATTNNKCAYCEKDGHSVYKCNDYLQLEINERIKQARSRKLCLNCLRTTSHQAKQCTLGSCRKCSKRHNTLLHMEQAAKRSDSTAQEEAPAVQQETGTASLSHATFKPSKQVILATALVKVKNSKGKDVLCRALLDSGSQSCFITEECARKLALNQLSTSIPIYGLGAMATQANRRVKVTVQSRVNKFNASIDCLIIDRITQAIPVDRIDVNQLQIPEGITLADPEFHKSSQVDLLLGAEVFFDLMCIGRIKRTETQPAWQKTLLGWIVSGNLLSGESKPEKTICNLVVNDQLSSSIKQFWQIEHIEGQGARMPEERACEEHFARKYKRNKEGRFIVSLPVREEQLQKIGDSKECAVQRFNSLEKRLNKQPQLKKEYAAFMHEYLELGHMQEITQDSARWDSQPQYYLPHHCVLKESSVTTKLRVVFDASCKSSSGISLNDALLVGPVLQQDLFSILLRFRNFKYVMVADIAKMYRQILLDEDQTPLQRIVWRDDPNENIKVYELLTLTYGTASASYLATKVIQQLANLEEAQFPVGAAISKRDFYMDDLITGADTMENARVIREQVAALLLKGGFVLRKWASNSRELLQGIPEQTADESVLKLDKNIARKTLGVKWNRAKDVFQYAIEMSCSASCTKRTMLSDIARIFDPLGLLAPVIVTAKILIQELWKLQTGWDESLPADIHSRWSSYVTDMQQLNEFCVERCVVEDSPNSEIQLHGFCDASQQAYGACVYIRSISRDGSTQVRLLCAKSRVAPLKTLSIPRLELCGAQLLTQLVSKVKASLTREISKAYYWTDSSIVLHWFKSTNKKLPVFVAHRVGEIQESTPAMNWHHVGTKENPADLVSRGVSSKELYESQLWWSGPAWLKDPLLNHDQAQLAELDEDSTHDVMHQVSMVVAANPSDDNFVNRFSRLQRLIRVTAICLRFANRCRKKEVNSSNSLTVEELEYAKQCLVKMEQFLAFRPEIEALRKGVAIPNGSILRHINPWLDKDNLLRVGGRLKHAELQYDTRHPLVLPSRSKLTELIILHEHARHCHAGTNATLAAVRQLYWPIRARGTVRKLLHKCIKCFRFKPRFSHQIMGDLPKVRVTPARPFTNVGVDFCGPIYVREGKRRGIKRIKAYVAVFICMVIKAVHLEVVSDLTTDAFLNAFKRFISRRGKPANVYSDNGTNFIGAKRELDKAQRLFSSEHERDKFMDYLASEGIKWHFIPARAPHFGGLWESAVKSFKTHFYKTAAEASMTFEEASTLVYQIEAILNSRPLTAFSDDPHDLNYLSPGHFLIGNTLTSYPEADLTSVKINRLSGWQLVEKIRQDFWKRWSSEYLLSLQRRYKWPKTAGPQIQVGQLVLCKEDGLPPLKWALGRVHEVTPGADKVVRAATIKTATGIYKRPAAKLCILPLKECTTEG